MVKRKKVVKKRRSKPKNADAFLQGEVISFLPILFSILEQKELKITNKLLLKDINSAKKIILYLESKDQRKYYSRSYKSYPYNKILQLGNILNQFHYNLKIGFSDEIALANRIEASFKPSSDDVKDVFKKIKIFDSDVSNLKKVQKLNPRFYSIEDPGSFSSGNEMAKYLLKYGLFDYLQRLVNGERFRPKKCIVCNEWFVANKKNKLMCTTQCRKKKYSRSSRGLQKIKINQRVYRENQKNKK